MMEDTYAEQLFQPGFFTVLESKHKRVYRAIIRFIYLGRLDNHRFYRRLFPSEINDYLASRIPQEEMDDESEDDAGEKLPLDYSARVASFLSFLNSHGWIRFNKLGNIYDEEIVLTEDARDYIKFEDEVRVRKEQGKRNTLRSLWAQMMGITFSSPECADMIEEFCKNAQAVESGLFGLEDSLEYRVKEFYDKKQQSYKNDFVERKSQVRKLIQTMMDNFETQERILIGDNCSARYTDPCEERITLWQEHQKEIVEGKSRNTPNAKQEDVASQVASNLKRLEKLFFDIREEGRNVSQKMTNLNSLLVEKLSFLYITMVDSADLDVMISQVIDSADRLGNELSLSVGYLPQGILAKRPYREQGDDSKEGYAPLSVPYGDHRDDAAIRERIASIERFSPMRIDSRMESLFKETGKDEVTSADFPITDLDSFAFYCCSLVRGISSPFAAFHVLPPQDEEYMTRTIDKHETRMLPVFRFRKRKGRRGETV